MKKGFLSGLTPLHEIHRTRAHAKDVHRVWRQMRRGVLIARVAIAFVIAMSGGSAA
jgi:hypothetical protein